MKKVSVLITTVCLPILFGGLVFAGELGNKDLHPDLRDRRSLPTAVTSDASGEISRIIDATKHFRPFPELVAYRNTSLQKATTPVLAELSEDAFGKAKITRCWLNLDEMWDYRTREFNFNFKIGVDNYKDIKEKFRESWNWEVESPVHYYDYLKAFSDHSEEIMLTIRRYERDIMDGILPVSMEDYKMLYKKGLKHYKMLCPNIRYVEVGNEYHGFMKASDEEYYQFYKVGYEAVNEVNEEMGLEGADQILVGGPVVSHEQIKRLDHFFELFAEDINREKRLDFIAWHDYHKDISETSHREKELKALLLKHGLPQNITLFHTEHDPYHFKEDKLEYHMLNTAYLPKSLYFNSVYSPEVKIFPWVLYHNGKIQTRFMWFEGPNEPDTKAFEMRMLPLGASMKMLSMHKGREIQVENSIEGKNLVLASVQKDRIVVQAINYESSRNINLSVLNIHKIFPDLKNGQLKLVKYLIDSNHSNCLAKPEYSGGLEKIEEFNIDADQEEIKLTHSGLEKNGLVLWEVIVNKINLD